MEHSPPRKPRVDQSDGDIIARVLLTVSNKINGFLRLFSKNTAKYTLGCFPKYREIYVIFVYQRTNTQAMMWRKKKRVHDKKMHNKTFFCPRNKIRRKYTIDT
eukprot:GEMP01102569.1.p1 GENE.GEMP01102569.1~~GEMP01102569.1.p1  ORF type:complete len:103 (-),score=4.52 GEMP01102569.1:104-412(-)